MARSYQDFVPDWQYIEGEAQDIIEIQAKDFKKNQLKVNFGNNGMLTISGERPSQDKFIRFRKEFKAPKECKASEIRARLSAGVLYITIPKKTSQQVPQQDQPGPAALPQPSTPVQDKGKLKQDSSIQRNQPTEEMDNYPTTEDVGLPTKSKPFVSRLKVEKKTALKVAASLMVLTLLFTVLFYLFKYNNFQILSLGFSK